MEKLVFRALNADEIECRVGATSKKDGIVKSFSLLLYKTARVDANILDETVGPFNWQKRFYQVKNTMICEISINANYEHQEMLPLWISKADGGDDDYTMEQVKGECSDSMKRAAFQWSIGRELYYGPSIWINVSENNNERSRYSVKSVSFDENKNMTEITIVNDKTKEIVYSFKNGQKVADNGEKTPKSTIGSGKGTIRPTEKVLLNAFLEELSGEKRDKFYGWLDKNFHTMNIETLSDEKGVMVCKKWNLM